MPTTDNQFMKMMRGTFAKQIVFRQYGNKTVASAYPDMSNRVLSEKQKKMNTLMVEANAEVKAIMHDDQRRNEAQLRLNVTRNKLYHALIREYIKNNKPVTTT